MNAIEIKNVDYIYPKTRRHEQPKPALVNVNLTIEEGHIFGLLGPNGSGKTTLFHILATRLKPTKGDVRIYGMDVVREAMGVRKNIGVLFQHPSLDKKLTVNENLLHQGHLYGISGAPLNQRIEDALQKFHLSDRQNDFVEHLSGGLQRRSEIAKGFLHEPRLLIMDEPSTGLDPGARYDLWDSLFELKKRGVTILITTHLMEEGDKCDMVAILHQGRLRAMGTPQELKSKIGGDIISIQTRDPLALTQKIEERFRQKVAQVDQTIRFEIKDGHKFIPQIVEAFPGLIQAITLAKPTLEDVFVRETGQRFWHEGIPL